ERLDAKVIARAEELVRDGIPDREREITEKMFAAFLAPAREREKHELVILRRARRFEKISERIAIVEAKVADDERASIERRRQHRIARARAEMRVAESNFAIDERRAAVGRAHIERGQHARESHPIDRRLIK